MRLKVAGVVVAICVALAILLGPILGENFHPIIDGRIYRSAQLDAAGLESRASEFGLASVVAVRPARPHKAWYTEEKAISERLGITLVNVGLSADNMPSRERLGNLVAALDGSPRPMLLHCRAGVERSGLASAVALLLEGESVESARGQFSLAYGFHPWLSQSDLPRVLDRYEDWLREAGIQSSGDAFRSWVEEVYVPAFYSADLVIVDFAADPQPGRAIPFSLRVTNRSPDPQPFRATRDHGVHVSTLVEGITDPTYRHEARAGHQNLDVAPGESHLFAIELAAVPREGRYRLTVDLVDESVAFFADMGSRVLVREFDVPRGHVITAGPQATQR